MKAPTKEEIKAALDKLQGSACKIQKCTAEINVARADLIGFENQIKAAGEPDYRDDNAVQRLSTLRLRAELCGKTLERISMELRLALESILGALPESAGIARGILMEIADNRLDTITRSMLIYSTSEESAKALAEQTDAYLDARYRIEELPRLVQTTKERRVDQLRRGVNLDDTKYILDASGRVQAVLSEALKRSPDLMQFLPFQSATNTGDAKPHKIISDRS